MRIFYNIKPLAVIFMTAAALSFSLCACKGRTASNMTPTGDTVEVVVKPAEAPAADTDSIFSNDSIRHEI